MKELKTEIKKEDSDTSLIEVAENFEISHLIIVQQMAFL